MAKLKTQYDKQEDIPEGARSLELYEEKDGKWVLKKDAIEGINIDSVKKLEEAARKEREEHKATKERLKAFGDLDPEETIAKLDTIAELESKVAAAGGDKAAAEKVEKMATELTELRKQVRDAAKVKEERDKYAAENVALKGSLDHNSIRDHIRDAAVKVGIPVESMPGVLLVANQQLEFKEGKVVTKDKVDGILPGLDSAYWFDELKKSHSYLWPRSVGAGAGGGDGKGGGGNPWSYEHWSISGQMDVMSKDPARGEALAKQAGHAKPTGVVRPPAPR